MPAPMVAAGEQEPGRLAQAQRGLGGHRVGIGGAADAIGAEQFAVMRHPNPVLLVPRPQPY